MGVLPRSSRGLFVPDNFHRQVPSRTEMNTTSIFFGIMLACSAFAATKGVRQTWGTWKRSSKITGYVMMIWGHWGSNMGIAVLTWMYLRGFIQSSFWLWLVIVFLWCFQVQLLIQIIVNRVSLLMAIKSTTEKLKWILFAIILGINISVFCIWIPARLNISDTWERINNIWDRTEKCIFLVIDASLNAHFVYLVRTRLIANGLTKYKRLFRFNVVMIFFSVSLDIVLVGLMSLPNPIVYLQFQCAAYMCKLQIEMNMADLICEIVKSSNDMSPYSEESGVRQERKSWTPRRDSGRIVATIPRGANRPDDLGIARYSVHAKGGHRDLNAIGDHSDTQSPPPPNGIKMTIETNISVCRRSEEEDIVEYAVSTRHIQNGSTVSVEKSGVPTDEV
ncbi:hypothetical protein F5Y15DRAFT_228836 [Xylariaceae sp. FL0016]|nr:hypothetical protein F5Y15DRAFT_228836 [Xylariaceae sp. FL0016]